MKYFLLGKEGKVNKPHLILACWYDCNLNCTHCYNSYLRSTIPVEKWEAVIEKWAKYANGNGIVHFKGGEPLLPKFQETLFKLTKRVKEKGLSLFFTTNGTTLKEELIKEIMVQTDMMIVSLNGSNSEIDEKLRRKGAFKKTIQGIKLLNEYGIPFAINYVVYKGNEKYIFEMAQLAKEMRAKQLNLLPLVKRGGALKEELQIPDLEIVLSQLEQVANKGLNELIEWSILDLIQKVGSGKYKCEGCPAGYKGLAYITPDGKVYSCPNTVFEEYKLGEIDDVLKKGFKAIFQGERIKKVKEVFSERLICEGELIDYTYCQRNHKYLKELEKAEALIRNRIDELKKLKNVNSIPEKSIAVCFNRNW